SSIAPIGPTPGILARRRLHSSALCQDVSLASTSSICVCSCAYSFACMANNSRASNGQALIGLDALEQRSQVRHPLGGSQAELGGMAADGVGQLRAIADQPVTNADQR